MELRLDRQLFFPDEWKAYLIAVADVLRPRSAPPRITVPRMSEAWLREHEAECPKHPDDTTR